MDSVCYVARPEQKISRWGRCYFCLDILLIKGFSGLWASQLPFRGRLISCNILTAAEDYPIANRFYLVFSQLSTKNSTTTQETREAMPQGAELAQIEHSAYLLPHLHPSPDHGLSVDVFKPHTLLQ